MQEELHIRNRDLKRDVEELLHHIEHANIPEELESFRAKLQAECARMRQACESNLNILKSDKKTQILLDEIISATGNVDTLVRRMSYIFVPALIRDPFGTHLSLKFLAWLHRQHPETSHISPVITDGGWAISPSRMIPVYYVPLLQQKRLLMQSLLFHEFGHLLHWLHKAEIDDLIREFQFEVLRKLTPSRSSNDRYHQRQMEKNNRIALTWYSWLVELFCDAVGFHIGGPSYLRAFSYTLTTMRRDDFHISQEFIMGSEHPVPWLRVQLLAERANSAGFVDLAERIQNTWSETASALNIEEEYYGIYDEILRDDIAQIIDDMLVEANPRSYSETDLATASSNIYASPVRLLNKAWRVSEAHPDTYDQWEEKVITEYLAMPLTPQNIRPFLQSQHEEAS